MDEKQHWISSDTYLADALSTVDEKQHWISSDTYLVGVLSTVDEKQHWISMNDWHLLGWCSVHCGRKATLNQHEWLALTWLVLCPLWTKSNTESAWMIGTYLVGALSTVDEKQHWISMNDWHLLGWCSVHCGRKATLNQNESAVTPTWLCFVHCGCKTILNQNESEWMSSDTYLAGALSRVCVKTGGMGGTCILCRPALCACVAYLMLVYSLPALWLSWNYSRQAGVQQDSRETTTCTQQQRPEFTADKQEFNRTPEKQQHTHNNKDLNFSQKLSPGRPINTRNINCSNSISYIS